MKNNKKLQFTISLGSFSNCVDINKKPTHLKYFKHQTQNTTQSCFKTNQSSDQSGGKLKKV